MARGMGLKKRKEGPLVEPEMCDGEIETRCVPDDGHPGEPWYQYCTKCDAWDDYLSMPHVKVVEVSGE